MGRVGLVASNAYRQAAGSSRSDAAAQLARGRRLSLHELPLPLPTTRIWLSWHERFDRDPGAVWLREQIATASAGL